MFDKEVDQQSILSTQVWEELSDLQGEVIRGGVADANEIITRNLGQIAATLTEKNQNFDITKFAGIVTNIADKNPNI